MKSLEIISTIEPIAPYFTRNFLIKSVGDPITYVNSASEVNRSVNVLLNCLLKKESFPSRRDLSELEIPLDTLIIAARLLNTDYKVDLANIHSHINWQDFDC